MPDWVESKVRKSLSRLLARRGPSLNFEAVRRLIIGTRDAQVVEISLETGILSRVFKNAHLSLGWFSIGQ